MNSDELLQSLQKGFHVTLGATASLVESIQDSQKRDENLSKLRQPDWQQLTEELATKGAQTEQEARSFVDTMMAQRQAGQTSETGSTAASNTQTVPNDLQREIRDLTSQIAALRAELERLRNLDTPS